MIIRSLAVITLFFATMAVQAAPVVIDFEAETPGIPSAPISENGFTLSVSGADPDSDGVFDPGSGAFTNGTHIFGWCSTGCAGLQTVNIASNSGAPFTLDSIDAANLDPGILEPGQTIEVLGNLAGGGTVSASLVLVLDTYTTFNLPANFTNLSSVEFTSPYNPDVGIDNIVVNAAAAAAQPVPSIPLPALFLLMALMCLFGLYSSRRLSR